MQDGIDPTFSEQSIEVDKYTVLVWIHMWMQNNGLTSFTSKHVLNFLVERCCLLREPSSNRIDFIHRSFMEYLAANEIVIYRTPYSLRTRIRDDQWLSTLQFCMETETGSNYFAGDLVAEIVKYLFDCLAETPVDRMLFLRVANLRSYCKQVSEKFMDQVNNLAEVLLPPMNLSEAKDSIGIPFEVLRKFLRYEQVGHSRESVYFAAVLLSEHQDERCSEVWQRHTRGKGIWT
jgi:hypothetical protein